MHVHDQSGHIVKIFVLGIVLFVQSTVAQQVQDADTSFTFDVDAPAYPAGEGPRLGIDEAHNNYHTMGGRYRAFAELLHLQVRIWVLLFLGVISVVQ